MNRWNLESNKRLRFEELESRSLLSGSGVPDASALAGAGFVEAGAASAFVGAQFPVSPASVQLLTAPVALDGAQALVSSQLTADTGAVLGASSLPGAVAQAQIQAQLQLAPQRSIGYDATTGVGQMLITTGSNTWGAQIWRADANETGR
jgi:hypothetical protein